MDYDEGWFNAHDLFSRVYVNDGAQVHFPNGRITTSGQNHINYGSYQCVYPPATGAWTASRFSVRFEVWDEDSSSNDDHLFRCAHCATHTATEQASPALRTAPSTASGLADLLCSRVSPCSPPG